MIGYIGRKTLSLIQNIFDLFIFGCKIISGFLDSSKDGKALVHQIAIEQIYFTAVQALYIIITIALIVGSLVIWQFEKIAGQYDAGRAVIILVIKELGPIITAIIIILRSATAVTVEISYMNILNEIDAIEMLGIDPIRVICIPRFIGITSAVVCLIIVFDIAAILGGYFIVWIMGYIQASDFLWQIVKAITVKDIVSVVVKGVCFGIIITLISMFHGLKSKRQITDIPIKTSKASIDCFFACIIINLVVSVVFYV
ncbi:MAG: ABC transporter permease [Desulfobacterales bacterium]|nr:ABC transporter permease [Desulfobacterales bacterium]MBF0395284.1 ABC transporter permease [Desulfobacterales bacterium]